MKSQDSPLTIEISKTKLEDLKPLFCEAIKKHLGTKDDSAFVEQMEWLLNYFQNHVETFPVITFVRPDLLLSATFSVIEFVMNGVKHYNCVMKIDMPVNETTGARETGAIEGGSGASLMWMPWLPTQARPIRSPGDYHQIQIFGAYQYQPRRTKCYDRVYPYSGQLHPAEEQTPPEISGLYQWANAVFGHNDPNVENGHGFNMCLENDYDHGRHYIGEHSDDEKVMGKIHDVACFVTGPANREAVFSFKPERGVDQKVCRDERVILKVRIPEGLYAMTGKLFQKCYTHEFPQEEEELFKKLCTGLTRSMSLVPTFPKNVEPGRNGASLKDVVQAAWIKDNRDKVKRLLENGLLMKLTNWSLKEILERFERWCKHRTSYTLRSFV